MTLSTFFYVFVYYHHILHLLAVLWTQCIYSASHSFSIYYIKQVHVALRLFGQRSHVKPYWYHDTQARLFKGLRATKPCIKNAIIGSSIEWLAYFLVACKQALRMGYSEICFRIARGCAREESLQWSSYDLSAASFSAWLIFHLASLLDSTKIATVTHSNRKTRTTQADISVKISENYCLKAKPWMGTSFPNVPYMI